MAVHVRVITSVFPQPGTELSLSVIATLPQVSEPVATPVEAELVSPVHSTVASAGQMIDGGVVSVTVMVCGQLELLPQLSIAVQVRVIVKFPTQLPGVIASL